MPWLIGKAGHEPYFTNDPPKSGDQMLDPPKIGQKWDWPPLKNDDFWLIFPLFRGIFVNVSLTPLWIEKDA